MSRLLNKITITTLTALTLSLSSYPAAAAIVSTEPQNNDWQFAIAPYAWAVNMNGSTEVGPVHTNVDEDFGDIVEYLNGGGMLWMDVRKGKWSVFFNGLYASLKENDNTKNGPFDVSAKSDFGLFSAGITYELFRHKFANSASQFIIEPYAGARYTVISSTYTLEIKPNVFKATEETKHQWTDPIVGLRFTYDFNDNWDVIVAGDVGGTDRSDDYSYNVTGLLGYSSSDFLEEITWYAGYRTLKQKYITGSEENRFEWDMQIFGPIIGFSFEF